MLTFASIFFLLFLGSSELILRAVYAMYICKHSIMVFNPGGVSYSVSSGNNLSLAVSSMRQQRQHDQTIHIVLFALVNRLERLMRIKWLVCAKSDFDSNQCLSTTHRLTIVFAENYAASRAA